MKRKGGLIGNRPRELSVMIEMFNFLFRLDLSLSFFFRILGDKK